MNEWLADKWRSLYFRIAAFRWFRNWRELIAAWKAGAPLPPLVLRNGLTLYHGPGDSPWYNFHEIFRDDCYTRGGFYRPRPRDTVLDVGANIGTFALYMQWRAFGVRVHCFEPASETRQRLKQNVEANGLQPFVSLHPVAVSDRRGEAELKAGRKSDVRSFFASSDSRDGPGEVVRCVRLDEALAECGVGRVDLLKIDVEGAELEIVEGAPAEVWQKIDRVALEFHDTFRPGCRDRVLRVLRDAGYRNITVEPQPRRPQLGTIRASR